MDPPKSGVTCTHNLDPKQCGYFFTNIMGTVPLFNGSIIFFTCHVRGKFVGIYKIVFYVVFIQQGFCRDDSDLHSILYYSVGVHHAFSFKFSFKHLTLHMINKIMSFYGI